MKKIRLLLVSGVLAVCSFAALVSPAYAITAPTASPTVLMANAYKSWMEVGDQIYFIIVDWSYGSSYPTNYPAETARQATIVRLLNGTTELASSSPIIYFQNGWGEQLIAIYFSAATAPTWGAAYTVQVVGNPLLTWDAYPSSAAVNVLWQTVASPQPLSVTRAELTASIPAWAQLIQGAWNATLAIPNNGALYLNEYGDAYLTAVIPHLHDAVPDAFATTQEQIKGGSPDKGIGYATTLRGSITGTIFDVTPLSQVLGLPMTLILSFMYSGLVGLALYKLAKWHNTPRYLMLEAVPFGIGGSLLGVLAMVVPILAGLAGAVYIIYSIWFEPASV